MKITSVTGLTLKDSIKFKVQGRHETISLRRYRLTFLLVPEKLYQ